MNLRISHGAACSFFKLAVTARVVYGILIDMPQLFNAGWLSILLGGILAFPIYLAVSFLQMNRKESLLRSFRILCAAFFLIFVYDAGVLATSIAESASYMALNSTPSVYLLLPLLVLCLFCLRFNGDALGSSAGIWNRILPCFLLIVVILQFRDYRPEWLTPVLGPGTKEILKSAVKAAGWFSQPAALFLLTTADEYNPKKHSPPRTLAACTVISALIAISFSMMTPTIPEEELFVRSFRLETLLANGRSGLAMQFPTIAIWYLGLFYALLFDVFTGSIMLQRVFPGWNRYVCTTMPLICTSLFAVSSISDRTPALSAAGWLYPFIAAMVAVFLLPALKGDTSHA